MHKGFTKTTLSLLGAALLSSSAFAVGPSLTDNFPNVFISYKTKNPAEIDTGNLSTGITDVYRYTDAIQLSAFVDPGDATADQLLWLFNERLSDAVTLATPGVNNTITINDQDPFATIPTIGDVKTSGNAIGTVGSADDFLDFRNVALTPLLTSQGTPPSDGVDEALIDLFVGIGNDSTDTLLFDSFSVYTTNDDLIAPNDLVTDASLASGSTSVFSPILCIDDFAGWSAGTAQRTADFRQLPDGNIADGLNDPNFIPRSDNDPGTFSPTPSVTVISDVLPAPFDTVDVTGSSASLSIGTDAVPANHSAKDSASNVLGLQFVQWSSFRRDIVSDSVSVPVAADNTLILARYTVEADAATQSAAGLDESTAGYSTVAAQTPKVRLRVGEGSQLGNGNVSAEFVENGLHSIINERTVDVLYLAKDGGTYEGTSTNVVVGFFADVVDVYHATNATPNILPNGQVDYGLNVNKIEVYSTPLSADRAELGPGQILYNAGAAASSLSPDDGSAAHLDDTGLIPFSTTDAFPPDTVSADWWGRDSQAFTKPTGSRAVTITGTPSLLSAAISVGDGSYLAAWDTYPYAARNDAEVATASNGKIVEIAAWYSSPNGSSLNNNLPGHGGGQIRIGYQSANFGGVLAGSAVPPSTDYRSHGRAGYFAFNSSNRTQQDVGYDMGNPYAAGLAPRMVSLFFAPNLVSDAASELHFRPSLEAWSFPVYRRTANTDQLTNDAFTQGTIRWHRVIIRSYDFTAPNPACP